MHLTYTPPQSPPKINNSQAYISSPSSKYSTRLSSPQQRASQHAKSSGSPVPSNPNYTRKSQSPLSAELPTTAPPVLLHPGILPCHTIRGNRGGRLRGRRWSHQYSLRGGRRRNWLGGCLHRRCLRCSGVLASRSGL